MFKVFLILASLTALASAQETLISGRVMDGSNGVPLAGATVSLHDAEIVTMTDAEGHFRFDSAITKQVDVPTKPPTIASSEMISFSKEGYDTVSRSINASSSNQYAVLTLSGKVTYVCTTADSKGRWQIARTIFDLASKTSEITYLTDTKWWNFKPNFSPDGSQLTFFRRYAVNGPCCETWRSSICVMNANGSAAHEIIEGESSFNTEPYWSRDGSTRISFNRMNVKTAGPY